MKLTSTQAPKKSRGQSLVVILPITLLNIWMAYLLFSYIRAGLPNNDASELSAGLVVYGTIFLAPVAGLLSLARSISMLKMKYVQGYAYMLVAVINGSCVVLAIHVFQALNSISN